MKVIVPKTIIEIDDCEKRLLSMALCIAEELANDAVSNEILSGLLVRTGLDTPRQAGEMRDLVSALRSYL